MLFVLEVLPGGFGTIGLLLERAGAAGGSSRDTPTRIVTLEVGFSLAQNAKSAYEISGIKS